MNKQDDILKLFDDYEKDRQTISIRIEDETNEYFKHFEYYDKNIVKELTRVGEDISKFLRKDEWDWIE